jgi:CBS domain-containing protein
VRDVVTASADESALVAARRMAIHNVGDLIVVVEQPGTLPRPIGIVTDRDLVVRVLAREGQLGADTRLADLIQRELITAHEDDDIEAVMTLMREHSIRRVPIVDAGGGLQGLISVDDVLDWMKEQLETATNLLARQGRVSHPREREVANAPSRTRD